MDFYNHENKSRPEEQQPYHPAFQNPGHTMACVSLFLGLAALFSVLTVFVPLISGGLAIVLALLSKGYAKKMSGPARIGCTCAITGICITVFILAYSAITIFTNPNLLIQLGRQYDATYESMYGQSAEDAFGFSFEDMMEDYADALSH